MIVRFGAPANNGPMSRWPWPAALILAAAVAAPATVQALGVGGWPWLVVTALMAAAVAGVPAKVLEDRLKRRQLRREETGLALVKGCLGGGRLRVRDILDPTQVGAHKSADHEQGPPPYVRRDVHGEVVGLLTPGRFLLLVGDSTAGKTRLAFEAVKEVLPDHVLLAPESVDAFDTAVEAAGRGRCVLWLDDVERFLGPGGLTVSAVSRMDSGVIVATLRREQLRHLTQDGEAPRVLSCADQVLLERRFTDSEIDRAHSFRTDRRIGEALGHVDTFGLAEYLAAGPALLQDWINGWAPGCNPRGAAIVAAAVDFRRTGFVGPIPKSLLSEIHGCYLEERGGRRLRPEPLADAWEWALRPRKATTALSEETEDADHVLVFDYLVDHTQRSDPAADFTTKIKNAMESAATRITYLDNSLIPDLAWSPSYAKAVFPYVGRTWSDEGPDVDELWDGLWEHRQAVLCSPAPPDLVVFLSEGCIRQRVGGGRVMAGQLGHLLDLAARPGFELRMLPFSLGAYPGIGQSFQLLEFRDAYPVVRRRLLPGDLYICDLKDVDAYLCAAERLAEAAADATASTELVTQYLRSHAKVVDEQHAPSPGRVVGTPR